MSLRDLVHGTLEAAGSPHALIGAAALAACGVARSTFDIDILTLDRRCLDEQYWAPTRVVGATVEVRRGDASDPLAGVVRIEKAGERPIDVIIGRFEWQRRALTRAQHGPGDLPVVQARDLVLLKLYAGGIQTKRPNLPNFSAIR
jgi:hypothetical protein